MLVVGDGPYSAGEVAGALNVPLAGVLPDDRVAAAVLSDAGTAGSRAMRRSTLLRSATAVVTRLTASANSGAAVGAVAG